MMACQTKSLHLAPLLTATNENVVMRQDFAGICLFARPVSLVFLSKFSDWLSGSPPQSLIRMFGPRGNPQARNLFAVIWHLQQRAGVSFHVAP
jgi:hypothetical protein